MGSSWTRLHLSPFPGNTLCCSNSVCKQRSVSPLTPQTRRGAFSSLNSLSTPFTAHFWERIDLLSGFWRRVVVRALKKNQPNPAWLSQFRLGRCRIIGRRRRGSRHIRIHPLALPFTRRRRRWPHGTPTCASREGTSRARRPAEGYLSL